MSFLRSLVGRRAILRTTSFCSSPSTPQLIPPTIVSKNLMANQVSYISQHHPMEYSASSSSQRLPASSDTLLITEKCKKRLKEILDEGTFLRISVEGGGCSGFQYKFEIDSKYEEEDVIISGSETDKTTLVIDKTSLNILKGSTVDYETELIRSAFRIINNPQAEHGCSCGSSFNVKID